MNPSPWNPWRQIEWLTPWETDIAGWNISMSNRKCIFKGSRFQIAILVYSNVFVTKKQGSSWRLGHLEFQMGRIRPTLPIIHQCYPLENSHKHSWILIFHSFQTVSWQLEVWFNDTALIIRLIADTVSLDSLVNRLTLRVLPLRCRISSINSLYTPKNLYTPPKTKERPLKNKVVGRLNFPLEMAPFLRDMLELPPTQ